ncbi:phosphatase PAP2 family protein [Amycolatopsis suaedae]|uniref:Phosphatase PAP2 family protein n=1 Tax=Amycolatopsis suaedae TaxID=2510978 RepID=A0A4Q7J3H7_9PSEU|nr:phosphatase PAP2 family protein [Amycolatopsis suaedae]RZQ61186.1 phosphatase PAP2 family protein [Amycolatopsis suaedae]
MRRSLILAAASACALSFVALGVVVPHRLPLVDRWALDNAVAEAGSALEGTATVVSTVAVLCGFAVLVATAARAAWRRPLRLLWCGALLVACAVPLTLQNVFGRPGPPGQPDSFSYPSGHATVAGAVAATAVVVATAWLPTWFRPVLATQTLAVLLTMASRVLLTEHYVTDVIGAVLGVAAVALFTKIFLDTNILSSEYFGSWTRSQRRSATEPGGTS